MGSLARQMRRKQMNRKLTKTHVPGHQYGTGDQSLSLEDLERLKKGKVEAHPEFVQCLNDLEASTHSRLTVVPDLALNSMEILRVRYQGWEVGYEIKYDGQGWEKRIFIKGPWRDMTDGVSGLMNHNREANEYMQAVFDVFFSQGLGPVGMGTTQEGFLMFTQDFIPPWALEGLQ